ncbi:GDSL esterase/lipase At2g40250-like [Macadamia integrifolia]|uniref:GDSL esterase/lipase At2g40250-like n=1 Tax=Macadamia integrifolia TaxID=60698 RepID=UPI001C531751|nr:GDSL esterase/lipase At2g40250-like [Macadamia integrifolia]
MEKGRSSTLSTPLFFFLFFTLFLSYSSLVASQNHHNITAVFSFGDSTLDPGNNDRLATVMRSDHPPYGRDFARGVATGRFSNGKLVTDMIVTNLGIKDSVPAYRDPTITNHDLLTGVSFASAGSGLDDLTANVGNVIHMSTQLTDFQQCLNRIQSTVGNATSTEIIQKAIFSVGAATNDMLFNYYDLPTRKAQYSLPGYHNFLLRNLENFVTSLYKMGARKISITGLPPIGCLPIQSTVGSITPGPNMFQHKCVEEQNSDSVGYNANLQGLITRLEASLPGAKIAYADIYSPLMDMIVNPKKYGFEQTLRGCCGTGYIEMAGLCNSMSIPICEDSSKFIFFDAIHPTEAAYQNLANSIQKSVLPYLVN